MLPVAAVHDQITKSLDDGWAARWDTTANSRARRRKIDKVIAGQAGIVDRVLAEVETDSPEPDDDAPSS